MRVAFLTNGSNEIGYGHVSRILVLHSFFREKNIFCKIIVPESFTFDIDDRFSIVKSFDKRNLEHELGNFDVIIIDSIESDYDKLAWTKETNLFIVSITLFLFDFDKRYEHISFYPSIDDSSISTVNSHTRLYSGRDFVVFREEFYNKNYIVRNGSRNILVTMGGGDPFGLTKKVLKAIENLNAQVTVLLSEKAKDYKEISSIYKGNEKIKIGTFTNSIVGLFLANDVAIINGGLTRYETCVIGIPFLALSIHDKQYAITEEFIKKGVGINMGVKDKIDEMYISQQVDNLLSNIAKRKKMSEKMQLLFDTRGVVRIYNIICQEYRSYEKND